MKSTLTLLSLLKADPQGDHIRHVTLQKRRHDHLTEQVCVCGRAFREYTCILRSRPRLGCFKRRQGVQVSHNVNASARAARGNPRSCLNDSCVAPRSKIFVDVLNLVENMRKEDAALRIATRPSYMSPSSPKCVQMRSMPWCAMLLGSVLCQMWQLIGCAAVRDRHFGSVLKFGNFAGTAKDFAGYLHTSNRQAVQSVPRQLYMLEVPQCRNTEQ